MDDDDQFEDGESPGGPSSSDEEAVAERNPEKKFISTSYRLKFSDSDSDEEEAAKSKPNGGSASPMEVDEPSPSSHNNAAQVNGVAGRNGVKNGATLENKDDTKKRFVGKRTRHHQSSKPILVKRLFYAEKDRHTQANFTRKGVTEDSKQIIVSRQKARQSQSLTLA
ncbi:hypothetical protein AAVH_04255 [Aphelenchoides avenae]|nr:hypothetical protein AAVH_04255 [Aphelenchus avenae]